MTEYKRPSGHECPPSTEDPADQPKPPSNGDDSCEPIPETTAPEPKAPPECPPTDCHCPPGPGTDPNCLETLISEKAAAIAEAEKAKAFKTDLEALLTKAKASAQEYTRDKFDKLVKLWDEQDREIAELIRKLVCAVPCWRCVIECYVCPLLEAMRKAEWQLYGDGTTYTEAHTLYDVHYWHTRDRDAKERRFNRIKAVLGAWEKPAQTIEKALADNAKLIADAGKALGADAPKVVFDVFLRLVPLHLAIAPPKSDKWTTRIGKEYTRFCECDTGDPDDCCGPDVGRPTLRQRLIGPQPYLIDPNDYFTLICCLVKHRYGKAQMDFARAEAAVATADGNIKRARAIVDNGLKSFDKDARAAIPTEIDCCDFDKPDDKPEQQSHHAR